MMALSFSGERLERFWPWWWAPFITSARMPVLVLERVEFASKPWRKSHVVLWPLALPWAILTVTTADSFV